MLQKFQDIFEVAIIQDKSKELLSVESLTIESDAMTIIRLCEDLLTITRSLKETWCLGAVNIGWNKPVEEQSKIRSVFNQFNVLTDKLTEFEKSNGVATEGI